jgi:hypothetical protein
MPTLRVCLLAAVATATLAAQAEAQDGSGRYALHENNFDMWCQEERHLPADRCDKRLPQDDADYQAYVSKIEGYEVQYLQEQRRDINIDRTIVHDDPIDHPIQPSAPQVNQVDPPPDAPPPR